MTPPIPSLAELPGELTAEAASERVARLVTPIAETEIVGIFDALDRVLADDLVSPLDVPPHDNAAMDGYAFDGTALAQARGGGSISLRCVGTVRAGAAWTQPVAAGDCLKIMTGAIMPPGLDTVVPLELAEVAADRVRVPAGRLQPGANRRRAGEDLTRGQPALRRGEHLTPAALGLVASLGLDRVGVTRRLRVAYFSTGDEILSLGEPPREGAVYDSNRYTLFGLLRRLGCEVIDLGRVRDDPALLQAAFTEAARRADAIITSGGVSVGEADFTQAMMHRLGEVAFWKIAMRPGRPMAVGRIASGRVTEGGEHQALLFGLPGNPVAAMVTFLAFVRPALLRMMGSTRAAAPLLPAVADGAIRKRPGRTEYPRGIVHRAGDGTLRVRTTGSQGSGVLSSMAQANALIVLPHARGDVAAGEPVDVLLFDGAM